MPDHSYRIFAYTVGVLSVHEGDIDGHNTSFPAQVPPSFYSPPPFTTVSREAKPIIPVMIILATPLSFACLVAGIVASVSVCWKKFRSRIFKPSETLRRTPKLKISLTKWNRERIFEINKEIKDVFRSKQTLRHQEDTKRVTTSIRIVHDVPDTDSTGSCGEQFYSNLQVIWDEHKVHHGDADEITPYVTPTVIKKKIDISDNIYLTPVDSIGDLSETDNDDNGKENDDKTAPSKKRRIFGTIRHFTLSLYKRTKHEIRTVATTSEKSVLSRVISIGNRSPIYELPTDPVGCRTSRYPEVIVIDDAEYEIVNGNGSHSDSDSKNNDNNSNDGDEVKNDQKINDNALYKQYLEETFDTKM